MFLVIGKREDISFFILSLLAYDDLSINYRVLPFYNKTFILGRVTSIFLRKIINLVKIIINISVKIDDLYR